MKTNLAGAVLVAMVCAAGAAVAMDSSAVLKLVEGSVMVNKGQSYRTAAEGTDLDVGDRIMVMEGSSAVVLYSDGCRSDYQENQIVTILRKSPCNGTIGETTARNEHYANPIAAGVIAAGSGSAVSSTAMVAGMTATFAAGSSAIHDSGNPISGE